jgi:hypothetical protein
MTSVASKIGATELPLTAGTANAPIAEPLLNLLLAYCGHWIKTSVDPQLSLLEGPSVAAGVAVAVTDACPEATRYPHAPGSWWMRDPALLGDEETGDGAVPALYIWERSCKVTRYSLVYDMQERNLGVFYVFPECRGLDGQRARAGLLSAINKALLRASQRNSHPTFTYQGTAYPNVPITSIIAERGRLAWELTESAIGFEVPIPSANAAPGGTAAGGYSQYGFPALHGTIMTKERIGHDSLVDPDDVAFDMAMDIYTNEEGDAQNLALFSQSVVPAPTGQP